MGIKYNLKTGKMFQSDISTSSLEKDKIREAQLRNTFKRKGNRLNITSDSVNIFDIVPENRNS